MSEYIGRDGEVVLEQRIPCIALSHSFGHAQAQGWRPLRIALPSCWTAEAIDLN